jgi:hypothetical protein
VERITKAVPPGTAIPTCIGKEEFDNLVMENLHDEGSGKTTGSSANAKRSSASEISGVFVEGNKIMKGRI